MDSSVADDWEEAEVLCDSFRRPLHPARQPGDQRRRGGVLGDILLGCVHVVSLKNITKSLKLRSSDALLSWMRWLQTNFITYSKSCSLRNSLHSVIAHASAKTSHPLLTFTSWVKKASPFPPSAMYHFQLSVIFRCFRGKFCLFLGKSAWLTTNSWHPGSQDQLFPQPWMPKAQWFPAVRALDIFSIFQQSSTATKYPDELREIFKTQGIIQLVSGRVKSFSRCKEGGMVARRSVPTKH